MVKSFAIQGIEGHNVDIETKILDGQPMTSIIGMGDTAVKESADRIQSAIDESGYVFPKKRVIISLAPGDVKKRGSHYDLAMAIGVLQEDNNIAAKDLHQYAFIGELCLDGGLRACCGILPMILAAKQSGIKKVIIPEVNTEEAKLVQGIEILGFSKLTDVIRFLEGKEKFEDRIKKSCENTQRKDMMFDFKDVKGQKEIIEASLLAAAGGHNMLMIGEPGCGKTMIAQRIPTILPEMTEEECLEVTKIYSISGLLPAGHSLIRNRPFRAPHHYQGALREIGNSVGIVGARRCSQKMKQKCVEIAQSYIRQGIAIVSGMAKGIDAYASTVCVNEGGYTIAVLGNGLDICYPAEHQPLMNRIREQGLLISEYPPGTKPTAYRFPQRNRIISAWSDQVIILAPGKGSGSLITGDYARKYGRKTHIIYQ